MQTTLRARCSFGLLALAAACGDSGSLLPKVTETGPPATTTTTATATDATTQGPTTTGGTTGPDPTTSGSTAEPVTTTLDTTVTAPLPTCGDGIVEPGEQCDDGNGDETDACTSLCRAPTCNDLLKSGDETDLDCGGSCPGCAPGLDCTSPADCQSGVCEENQCGLGCVQWTRQWGNALDDGTSAVAVDAADNIFVAGYANDGQVSTLKKFHPDGLEEWSEQVDAEHDIDVSGVTIDGAGNVIVTGAVLGALDGNVQIGLHDAAIVKYDTNGALLWSRQFGSIYNDFGYDVAVDGADNVIVVGDARGPIDGVDPVGDYDVLVAKFDAQGDKLWARLLGSSGIDAGHGVATDSAGNIYVVGWAYDDFDGQVWLGSSDAFITKFDADGVKQWTHQFGSTYSDYARDVAVDAADSVYVTGRVGDAFDGHVALGGGDAFLIKYDGDGVTQWSRQFGSDSSDTGNSVVVTGTGELVITGTTGGDFEGNPNIWGDDLFVANFSAAGAQQWTHVFGSKAHDHGGYSAVLSTNTPVIVGRTEGNLGQPSNGGFDAFATHRCLP